MEKIKLDKSSKLANCRNKMIDTEDIEILKKTMNAYNLEERRPNEFIQQVESGFFELRIENNIAYLKLCNSNYRFVNNGIQRVE